MKAVPLPFMQRVKKKLSSQQGMSIYLLALILFIVLAIIFAGLSEYTRISMICTSIRTNVEKAITTTATSNAYNTYHGVREGNSGAYEPNGSGGWSETVTTADVVYKLKSLMNLKYKDGGYIHNNKDGLEFKISNINVEAEITPLGNNKIQSTYHTTCVVEVPFSMGFKYLPYVSINMALDSTYVPRF